MIKKKILIIGAGPAGIGCALRLLEKGFQDFLIIEKNDYAGGLATTFTDENGFLWDIGGHVQFSHYKYFDEAMERSLGKDGWFHHQRESWVWIHDRFVPYPFQNNIHRLDPEIADECLQTIKSRNLDSNPENFKDWLTSQFGTKLCEIFMHPYNYKVWAYDSSKLLHNWVSERVAPIDESVIEENLKLKRDQVSWGPNATFQFPKNGGTGAIWKSLASEIPSDKILYNQKLTKLNLENKTLTLENGDHIEFENLFSSIPLDQLCFRTESMPESLVEMAKDFKHSSTHVVGIGIKGKLSPELETKCWMYFPEEDCPFYRTTVFSNYSPNNVPSPEYYSLMTETSSSSDKHVDTESLVEETIQGLKNTKLIPEDAEIASKFYYSTEYGYPTPFLNRDKYLNEIIPYLEKYQVYSRGRFGAWKYEISNQDHTFMQGVEWSDYILDGVKEETFSL